ncbi:MAG: diguanylate cyclase [Actinocatenispora sp.]
MTDGTASRLWWGYLLCGVLVVAVYYAIPGSGTGMAVRVAVYGMLSISAAVAVFCGVARWRPRPMLPWLLIGSSQLLYAVGDLYFYVNHYLLHVSAYPALSDLFYLLHYPPVVVGLVLLIRRRRRRPDLAGLLDAAILAVVAAMLSWLYLLAPQTQLDLPLLVKATSLAYPVLDLVLLAVSVRLILGGGRRPTAFFLLSSSLLVILAADAAYAPVQLTGTYDSGNYLDAIWLVGNLLLGAAALHPTMAQLSDSTEPPRSALGTARIVALCLAALLAPVTLVIQDLRGELRSVLVVAAACGLLIILTIARLAGLVVEQRKLAVTDSLTGLNTRRYFEAQLPVQLNRARRAGGSLTMLIVDVDRFKSINDRYGHPAGDRALIEIAARIRTGARANDILARYGGEEFALLAPNAGLDELRTIAERLRHQVSRSPVQVADHVWITATVSVGAASFPQHGETLRSLVETADRALYASKRSGRDHVTVGAVQATQPGSEGADDAVVAHLCQMADEVDARLSGCQHSDVVGQWSALLCTELGCADAVVRRAALAGRLHDIGKIVVPERILTKPDPLTGDEWRALREHPDHGYRIARTVPGLRDVAEVIRQHHEHFDGTGYPRGLAGAGILLEARVVAVCDAWAAMRADRAYQTQLTPDQAVAELRDGRGGQFDPRVVDAFLDLHGRGRIGALARLDGSSPAVVRVD